MDVEEMLRIMGGDDRHPCTAPGCTHIVEFDDEPWCFIHSPDSGSSVPGYSYRATH
jgi:hypothetical protein